ncbi:glycosyl transferase [Actinoplanes lobatus]|uniref:Glycosyl transferase n=1 Tax=Actinoplanes lobatus TaxID=113568 RepID=A0A7W7HNE0_9ACTN|nr:glycosyltransferase [Actinoplanes lobatus]MBB4753701.1 UDP:flavonoid glycosyltransferase YjiC (YdhE family) [Actinoplanes lobatus]GGN72942.1 glycosyl transferase [Actinoplanes lobatus]GIE44487.1 glycosyl transferase [Actinoplanes lobatus]
MSRFLIVVPPLTGHLAPLRAVAARLAARGHHVVWAGTGRWLRERLGPTAEIHDCVPVSFTVGAREPGLRGLAALRFLVEDFLVPLATAMLPGLRAAIIRHRPDVVVADQQAWAGAYAAAEAGLPWATSASTSAELLDPYPPALRDWLSGCFAAVAHPRPVADPRMSPHLILAFTTPELTGPATAAPSSVRWVGPAPLDDPGTWTPPWPRRPADSAAAPGPAEVHPPAGRPLVLVTLGTQSTETGARFLRACAEALAARPGLHAVITDPGRVVGPCPGHVHVTPWVPQQAVLKRADLVICHAGHNTVAESLWHGRPLVVAPIRDDQSIVAGQVVNAGAGVRLRFAHATAAHIGAAVDTIHSDPGYAHAAARIRAAFHAAGGADEAVTHLESLARSTILIPEVTR